MTLTAFALVTANVFAYDFQAGKLYYNIISLKSLTAEVSYNSDKTYSGDIVIPSQVTYNDRTFTVIAIGDQAFKGCSKLTSIEIPNSVTEIGKNAFEDCENLTYIYIPNSVTKIGEPAFQCSALTDVHIPEFLNTIEPRTFSGCSYLESVTIPKSVTHIGHRAFLSCKRLTSIAIPDAVTEIEEYAFCMQKGALNTVYIGKSVQTIGTNAFVARNGIIDKFYCRPTTPPTYPHNKDRYVYSDDNLYDATLYVPIGCKSVYSQTEPWKNFKRIEEMDFSGVGSVDSDEIRVTAANGRIMATGTDGEEMTVYNTAGQLVYRGTDTSIDVPTKGIYIVHVAGQTFKLAL